MTALAYIGTTTLAVSDTMSRLCAVCCGCAVVCSTLARAAAWPSRWAWTPPWLHLVSVLLVSARWCGMITRTLIET